MHFSNSNLTRILVVEDDLFMQSILKEYLGKKNDVKVFFNGLAALGFMQAGNIPDIIIADLNTPQLSGLELIAQLQASDFFRPIPVIILSGEDSTVKRVECLDGGADDFVVKPFNPDELRARIKVILRRTGKLSA